MPKPVKIRIVEMGREPGVEGLAPTGREILMDSDSPLFVTLGEQGRMAVQTGNVAVGAELFEQVKQIIEEADG